MKLQEKNATDNDHGLTSQHLQDRRDSIISKTPPPSLFLSRAASVMKVTVDYAVKKKEKESSTQHIAGGIYPSSSNYTTATTTPPRYSYDNRAVQEESSNSHAQYHHNGNTHDETRDYNSPTRKSVSPKKLTGFLKGKITTSVIAKKKEPTGST
jgi:hypothetical protein